MLLTFAPSSLVPDAIRSSRLALRCGIALLATGLAALHAQESGSLDQALATYRSGNYEAALKLAIAGRAEDESEEAWWRLEAETLHTLGRYREAYDTLELGLLSVPDGLWLMLLHRAAEPYVASSASPTPLSQGELVRSINRAASIRGPGAMDDADFLAAISAAALSAEVEPKFVLERFLKPAQEKPTPSRDAFLVAGRLALDKDDPALASRNFRAGLNLFPEDPDLLIGLAEAFRPSNTQEFLTHTYRALAGNARHVGAHLLLAQHHIDAEDYEAANEAIEQVLTINPRHPEAFALRAAIASIRDETAVAETQRLLALANWATNPRVDYLIGQKLSRQYRFQEGVAAQRRALAFDPNYLPAQLQLAQDLLRIGREDEGWALAQHVHETDGYNIEAFNLTSLYDRVAGFTTVESPHFRVRMSPEEARIYGARALALLEEARADLTSRYGIELEQVTTVEIYPDPADFAVRTFGMPGVGGYLGVCFGPVFTVNSPASSRANWEAVLWHEFAHVVTLALTRNRMPRWLSEGISVYEELRREPGWGQRMTVGFQNRIVDGRMKPISQMSAAFLEARSSEDTLFAYYQSYLVVEFLVQRYGFEPLRKLLVDLAGGRAMNDALAAWFAPMEQLEPAFDTFARERAEALAPNYDLDLPQAPEDGDLITQLMGSGPPLPFSDKNIPQLFSQLRPQIEAGEWADIRDDLEPIVEAGIYLPEPFNAHSLLAAAYRELGDTPAERRVLETIVAQQADALAAITRLLDLARDAEDWPAIARWSNAWLAVNPLAPTPWRARFESHRQLGESPIAIEAAQTLLQLNPPDRAALHYGLAELYQRERDLTAARRHVLLALEDAPRFRDAYRLLQQLPESTP